MTKRQEKLFWMKVAKTTDTNGCWLWLAATDRRGYGLFSWTREDGRYRIGFAHRAAWLIVRGGIADCSSSAPGETKVLHSCDNPTCVRPKHLFLGTQFDNLLDRDSKGRTAHGDDHYTRRKPLLVRRGERHPLSKLTRRAVDKIKRRRARGETLAAIAARFGISAAHVSNIVNEKKWKSV